MSKEKKRRKSGYVQADINAALEAVKRGMSLGSASSKFNIPKSTLYTKHTNKVPIEARMGPSTILTNAEENRLAEWINLMHEREFSITKKYLLDNVQRLIIKLKRKTPFTNDRPGRHWFEGFLRRHPDLTPKIILTVSHFPALISENGIRDWFNKLHDRLSKLALLNVPASRVFNCDENVFLMSPKPNPVISKKGSKSMYKINIDEKECLTTLFMVNAEGSMVPPMVMYGYKRIPYGVSSEFPKGWHIGLSEDGRMTAESFYEYITNFFHQWLVNNNIEFPVILYLKKNISYLSFPLVEFCMKEQIELIALYPDVNHILQPLDVGLFHILKDTWEEIINRSQLGNESKRLKREKFAPLLEQALNSINLTETLKNAFECCGLLPLSANKIDYNIFNGNEVHIKSEPDIDLDNDPYDMIMNNSQVANSQKKYQIHLEFFEENLDNNVLQCFKEALFNGPHNIEIQNEGLFLYWMKLKNQSGI